MNHLLHWFITLRPVSKLAVLSSIAITLSCCCMISFSAMQGNRGGQANLPTAAVTDDVLPVLNNTALADSPVPEPTALSSVTAAPITVPTETPTASAVPDPTPTPGSRGADLVLEFKPGPGADPKYGDPTALLGEPDLVESPCCTGMLQLGRKGSVIVAFTDNIIVNLEGPDFQIYGESANDDALLVQVSDDGVHWHGFQGIVTESPGGLDLDDVNQEFALFVRLTDVQPRTSTGAEVDAVVALHSGSARPLPSLATVTVRPTARPTATPRGQRPMREIGWLCDYDGTGAIRLWTAASMQATVKDIVGTCVYCCVDVRVYEEQLVNGIIFYRISVGDQAGWVDVDYFYWKKPNWCTN